MSDNERRKPRAFRIDDPVLSRDEDVWVNEAPPGASADAASGAGKGEADEGGFALPSRAELAEGFRWGSLFITAMISLAMLALGVWFARFASAAVAADGIIGWLATSLVVLLCAAGLILALREFIGFRRLTQLEGLRTDATKVLAQPDPAQERKLARRIASLYIGRESMQWQLREFQGHQGDVQDPGDLLQLVDRDLLQPLDKDARRIVLRSAKRVSVVTALNPFAVIDMIFVFFETLSMLRSIATLYGGRPGFLGGLRLGRMVLGNLIAAGGIALTDDLLGQFLGQDLLRRVSRKLGEGAFNGALLARIGVAAIDATRPVPHIVTDPVRLRGIFVELFRRTAAPDADTPDAPAQDEGASTGRGK